MKLVACSLIVAAAAAAQPNLDFLSSQVDGRTLRDALPTYLKERVRQARRTSPATPQEVRARFLEGIGGLPERTPLNARVTGTLGRDGYRIEKVVFESQPGFYVTANLYLPLTGTPPYPAILFPIGHEPGAKAYPVWQQILGTFARRGYVALAWDQLGQGERIQHWDEASGDSKLGSSTTEHTVLGIQNMVIGDALARYTVWDGIRALDYLLSRPEVDPKRVGVTGNSGGGTHTAYLSTLDDRLHVAAPSCYITSWKRLLETIGPQDAEQCIPGFLGAGLDHVDFVRAFAPKPYMMLSAIRDFFSIEGARATFAEASATYPKEKLAMTDTDEGHGYSAELRLASYKWFDRWLKAQAAPEGEGRIEPATPEELACTKTGQVLTSLGGQTVFTLSRERARAIRTHASVSRETLRKRIQWRDETTPPKVRPYGVERRGDLAIEKLVIESEPGIPVPAVIVSKAGSGPRPAVLLASARGKRAAWSEIEALANRGAIVMAVDVRGLGETRSEEVTKGGSWNAFFGDWDSAMTAVMLGSSLPAQRAYDIQRAYYLLASRPGVDRVYGAAQGNAAPALLHAAAAGVPFAGVLLDGMLASYRSVTEAPIHRGIFEAIVPGAIRDYDLPQLAGQLKKAVVVDAVSPMGRPLPLSQARAEFPSSVKVVARTIEEPVAAAYALLLD